MRRMFFGVVVLSVVGCASSSPAPATVDDVGGEAAADGDAGDVAKPDRAADLERYLTGRFDSVAQSKTDLSYFAIQLETCKVAAPELGERVLYIEQARMETLAAPYRQRLYVIEATAEGARSRVFELVTPAAARGLCKDPSRLSFTAAMVTERAGCAVHVRWEGEAFVGGTLGKECPSELSGATYATSEVTLDAAGMRSWDRGFDATGTQKWGAVKGPYVFERRTPLP